MYTKAMATFRENGCIHPVCPAHQRYAKELGIIWLEGLGAWLERLGVRLESLGARHYMARKARRWSLVYMIRKARSLTL